MHFLIPGTEIEEKTAFKAERANTGSQENLLAPTSYRAVLISSTFTDLTRHRAALIKAIDATGLKVFAMENYSATSSDVLDSSIAMMRKAAAYVGIIGHRYGPIPEDPKRNPDRLSLTELEFNEAIRLGRPTLIFVMGPDHLVKASDIEVDPERIRKLSAFRESVKRILPDRPVNRVYKVFNDLHEFEIAAMQSVAELRRHLDEQSESSVFDQVERKASPAPPALYAVPPYIGSHQFVGRESELEALNDWAAAANPHPVLLFDAIGGAGKSMLAWKWITEHATMIRQDWAGRFWYSFYDKGAVMADFCRHAISYTTGRPFEELLKKKRAELGELLLYQLRARPWLFVLDGLERVLVAYHRIDAAQLTDEQASIDQIAHRDACAATLPDDDELLRALTAAAPSKLLLTSRLFPRVLLNSASLPIPGVRHERIRGLRPADAETLLRSCGVTGTSQDIRNYLQSHCDCHPLVTGVVAGLINNYLPDRGNFDAWAADPAAGAALNLANLDLVQKRRHIIGAALDALPEKNRELLGTLALLSEAVDFETLSALNPHLPPEPQYVEEPEKPENTWTWKSLSTDERAQAQHEYQVALQLRKQYEVQMTERRRSSAFLTAPRELIETVRDLEQRGLLQYDSGAKRYDLHPVIRGVAAGGLRQEEREHYGQQVVDYFSRRNHDPYEEAKTLDDVRDGLHIVRALIQMERYQAALQVYRGDLGNALFFNLEAYANILSLLRPFFQHGWASLPRGLSEDDASYLANVAGNTLQAIGESFEALAAYSAALQADVGMSRWHHVEVGILNISSTLLLQNRIAAVERCGRLALDLATLMSKPEDLFVARLHRLEQLALMGRARDAEEMWKLLDPMGRDWNRAVYRPGQAELAYAEFHLRQGDLKEEHLAQAERLAQSGKDRSIIRRLHGLRGKWQLKRGDWTLAANALHDAVRMAREVEQPATAAEAQLALANFHLGRLSDPRHEAEQLSHARNPAHGDLAALWLAIGDREQAKKHALAEYQWAWADGEPYVRRYESNRARTLLEELNVGIPSLLPYDLARDEKFSWEDEVVAAIEKLRAVET